MVSTALPIAQGAAVTSSAPQLPQGGTKILGHYRVVAYYGGVGGGGLGVLGSKPPRLIAGDIIARAKQWRGYGLPVQPAMELIATVAQGAPGPDGSYSKPITRAALAPYLRVAHRHKMLLILDFQPGRAEFLDQVKQFRYVLTDPWVSVALDPEWKMGPHQVPGNSHRALPRGADQRSASLPVRHRRGTAPARQAAGRAPVHVPGCCPTGRTSTPVRVSRSCSTRTVSAPHAPRSPRGSASRFPAARSAPGFKLFLRQDRPMMSPDRVMARRPKPDLITYQ